MSHVEPGEVPQVTAELDVDRVVETKLLSQSGDVARIRRARFAGQHVDDVARRQVNQREVDDDDTDEDADRLRHPPGGESFVEYSVPVGANGNGAKTRRRARSL